MSTQSQKDKLGLSILNLYKSNRSLFLNSSYVILITLAFSSATSKGSDSSPDNKKKSLDSAVPNDSSLSKKASPRISKDAARRLFHSAIPKYNNPAIYHLLAHLVLLVVRAFLTIKVATLDGKLVGALVTKKLKRFSRLLAFWMFLGIPASIVNSLLTWTQSNFRKSLRENMNNSIMEGYLPDNLDPNYYSLIQLSDNKIKDPDQRISTDVARLASALASLPGQLLKPTLDLMLCARELGKSGVGSGEGTLALGLLAHFSTIILRFFSPPFAKLASEKANLEGQLRSAHSKIVTNSEEIAFLRGHHRELDYVDICYYQLEKFLKMEMWKKAVHEIAQTFIVKYFWGAAGLVLCSAPVFINKYLGKEPDSSASGDFITNRRLLLSASDSLDRLIYSRRFLLQVVGHATRVSDFQDVLHDIQQRRIELENSKNKNKDEDNVTYGDEITFKDVRLVTPADVTLIEKLNFSIKHGQHLLIAGPNGSGKSSLFRMLGGLWPCKEGEITIPTTENMFYLPQRAYLCKGTLREQVIYPHTIEQYTSGIRGKKDSDLESIMEILKLKDLLIGDKPWDTVRNWNEELSVGAQQRLAMARLYYHQPKFAVLDECTSAVSPTMEQFMYEHAQELGISLLSVAHRPALWHYHNYLLKFDGKGGYFFGELDAEKRLKIEEERLVLEKNLRDVPTLRERLQELKKVSNAHHLKYTASQKNLIDLNREVDEEK
ncbi:peroxisomal long-chain fatty acid import protein 1 [[Candida] railenensis]|uniref:Peroxisomal long-chain fatty acid import protein 1 n=1 Tax=[Candida] railenensis TaxID=45579 RepID=A0A9P0QVY0_9ASCO|nr:peroxisomal long-chain fatty acid import protein 1 [[Candida] railenensis]